MLNLSRPVVPLVYLHIHLLIHKPFVVCEYVNLFISSAWSDKSRQCHKRRHLIIHAPAPLPSNQPFCSAEAGKFKTTCPRLLLQVIIRL